MKYQDYTKEELIIKLEELNQNKFNAENEILDLKVKLKSETESKDFYKNIFDSLSEQISVIDSNGVIISVNQAWVQFALENNASKQIIHNSLGLNYLNVCEKSIEMLNREEADEVKQGLLSIIRKEKKEFSIEYPCHSPTEKRWFRMHASTLNGPKFGIVIAHENITNQKLSEEKYQLLFNTIKESEIRFRTMADSTVTLIWTSGPDKLFNYFNKAWLDYTGRTLEQEMGNGWTEGVHPDDFERCLKIYVTSFDARIPFEMDYRLKRVNGKYGWICDQGIPRFAPSGEFMGYIGSCTDITERLKKEEELLKLNIERGVILDNIANCVFFLKDRKVVWANNKALQMFGYSKEELYGEDTSKFYYSRDFFESFGRAAYSALWKGEVYRSEEKMVRKNREIFWCILHGQAINPNDLNEGSIWVLEDIDERKNIELELKNNKEKLQYTIEGMKAGIWEWNIQTGETVFNKKWAEIIGYTLEELQPISIETWMKFAHPNDLKKSEELLQEHFRKETEYYTFDSRMKHKNGTWVWVFDQGKVLEWDENGKPLRMYGTHIDITDRKKAEEIINLQNFQLSELNNSKDKFFSIIAHDLKSPFNGFLGLTKMMIEDMESFTLSEIKNWLIKMNESAQNLFALLENLLTWSRMQRGIIEFNPDTIIISYLINQNLNLLSETSKLKSIEITAKIPINLIVFADMSMIDSILRNLISNAIKFTHRGGKVIISAKDEENVILISVQDSGVGMSLDTISKLFQINEKISKPGTEGESSTGLGLLLCKEFIDKHGGKIWVESEVGIGSTFSFSLPKKEI